MCEPSNVHSKGSQDKGNPSAVRLVRYAKSGVWDTVFMPNIRASKGKMESLLSYSDSYFVYLPLLYRVIPDFGTIWRGVIAARTREKTNANQISRWADILKLLLASYAFQGRKTVNAQDNETMKGEYRGKRHWLLK